MSGGSHGYIYSRIEEELGGQMQDAELNDLVEDFVKLAHDLEWMDSSDISPERYRETVAAFKQKWFAGDRTERLRGYIDEATDRLREEMYALIGGPEQPEPKTAKWVMMYPYKDALGRPRFDFACSACHCKYTCPEDQEPPTTCPFCKATMTGIAE